MPRFSSDIVLNDSVAKYAADDLNRVLNRFFPQVGQNFARNRKCRIAANPKPEKCRSFRKLDAVVDHQSV
jgi:hypothetical protein